MIVVWAAAALLAEPIDKGAGGGSTTIAATAGLPTPLTNDPGIRPPVHNRFTVRPASPPTPVRVHFKQPPRAGLLFDLRSGRVLWQLNPRRPLPIASLTKMMTALIIAQRHRLRERVLITPRVLRYAGSGVGVLPRGKRVKLGALLDGLLLVSGNDAAIALAQHDAQVAAVDVRGHDVAAPRRVGEAGLDPGHPRVVDERVDVEQVQVAALDREAHPHPPRADDPPHQLVCEVHPRQRRKIEGARVVALVLDPARAREARTG